MKAIGINKYGGPEVLQMLEVPEPHAGAGEVRIRVLAAGINPADVMLRKGVLHEYYKDLALPFIPGMDVSGIIDEMGDNVDPAYRLTIGEEVVGIVDNKGSYGGYSEFVVLPASSVTRKPGNTSFLNAASFPMNALTARCALDVLKLKPGATLLVTGAAGAFGGYVTQLAAFEGINVIAVASNRDEELLRSFGATVVIQRGEDLVQRIQNIVPEGVDAVADGALLHGKIVPVIRENGQIAVVNPWDGVPGRGITVHPLNVRISLAENKKINKEIARLSELIESGVLTTRVAAVFPATEVVKAHELFDQGGIRGRIILDFTSLKNLD